MSAESVQFHHDAERLTRDLRHRALIRKALGGYYVKRDEEKAKYTDWQQARISAAAAKHEAVNHLDKYLIELSDKLAARGTRVFWAADGDEAAEYISSVARNAGVKRIIKSKTMTGEEIHLPRALEKAGYEVVESDLGEFIVQLREEAPYHIVFPSMHLTRGEISDVFEKKLGSPPADTPEELTMIARDVMRKKYCEADMGISGANFAVAETGHISITENEGNARLSTSLPGVLVSIVGIEKVVPRLDDLVVLLPMLATAGAGQNMTCYNTLLGGPRQPGETDGPGAFHVVLLDNRRTALLADAEQRDALHCIRCGACLNVCPIFKNIGGHSYGTTYQGPIGSVITPHLRGLQSWKHLSFSSSLCGACTETCPVKIDLHHHLLQNRRNAIAGKPVWWEKPIFAGFAWFMCRPALYRLAAPLLRLAGPVLHAIRGKIIDPARLWTATRDLPPPPQQSFKEYWNARRAKR
ncbi:MAG: LutB/LldF family L-lactate oxidation iron-sulfur protein [Terrimicrobiaceae bacterium]|jgi:L-lactate dehydrogenase complex protein LldF|nr:LutB/LldF family L-lactate oxidation iron-sulfur protein [Terrimicrobiaceae bacterium]